MPIQLSAEEVIALAPDDSSAKSGRGLASLSKWESVGCSQSAVWGECKGSGKNPYQVTIDLAGPAFKCSCPSRKFPCKHALGLFLLYAAGQVAHGGAAPGFCAEWLARRAQSSERKKEKSDEDLTADDLARREKAKTRRVLERETKVADGLRELALWLKDLVRQGLANAQSQPTEYWEKMAKRLVDAQAPSAARLVLEMSSSVYRKNEDGRNWAERLLEQLGKIHLICESYGRIAELPAPVRADVRTAVGFTVKEEDLTDAESIEDTWAVHGVRIYDEDKLRVQRVWMRGAECKRDALVVNFAFRNQALDVGLVPGTKIKAALVFYPGNYPQRAFLKSRGETLRLTDPGGYTSFAEFLNAFSAALSQNLWLEAFPAMLEGVIPVRRENSWHLQDRPGNLLPLDPGFEAPWKLFAVCGNRPAPLFAEWNGETLIPLTVWTENKLIRF